MNTHISLFMKKYTALLMSVCLIVFAIVPFSIMAAATQSRTSYFNVSGFSKTGNGATDMVNIARLQKGKTGANLHYTEAWCADFVSDCAILAGQTAAIASTGSPTTMHNSVINAGGRVVTSPQAGDLMFRWNSSRGDWGHVGIMINSTTAINGNYSGSISTAYVKELATKYEEGRLEYVRPNYRTTTPTTPTTPITPEITPSTYNISIYVGESYTLSWTFNTGWNGVSIKPHIDGIATYKLQNGNLLITGTSPGRGTIDLICHSTTVTVNLSVSAKPTAAPTPTLSLSQSSFTLTEGQSATLYIYTNDAFRSATKKTADPSIASVSFDGWSGSTGSYTIKGLEVGTTTLDIYETTYTNVRKTVSITVLPSPNRSISLSQYSLTLYEGESAWVNVYLSHNLGITRSIKNTSVISGTWGTRSTSGLTVPLSLTGKSAGSTTVTFYYTDNPDRVLATLNVTVISRTTKAPTTTKKTTSPIIRLVLLGDANDDYAVNMKDVLLLRKRLSGMSVTYNFFNSDCNKDGTVNMKDVLMLRKYLAGIIGKLGA